ncbi:MAG: cyanophycinase [Cyanobacteria bacterium P01_D01_bin.105]
MLELESRSSHSSMIQQPIATSVRYPIMVIGGAEDKLDKRTILSAFYESAGGSNATIGIIPAASREPSAVGDRYYKIFGEMGAKQVQILDIRHPEECDEARWLEVIEACTGIFVTGGDQVRLCDLLGDSHLIKAIKQKVHSGQIALAGTSAGAAMMGERMIAGGSSGESPNPSLVDLSFGLGVIPEMLVDQHFHNRNRMARLLSAVSANPDKLGVGIDEDTCIAIIDDSTFEVVGKGVVTIVDPGELTHTSYPQAAEDSPLSLHNLKLHILKQGDKYNYKKRVVL